MKREMALDALHQALPGLRERFGVRRLWMFGSVARDEAKADSDIDLLVEFEGPATFDRFMGLCFELEDSLHLKVDLATQKMLRPGIRANVERDLIEIT